MTTMVKEGSLGSILLKARIIDEQDINAALTEQQQKGVRFGEALLTLGIVTQEDINWALSSQLDIPYLKLKQDMIDPDALQLIPAEICRRYQLIPFIKAGDELSIVMADPLDKVAINAAAEASGCHINLSVALPAEIMELIELCYGPAEEIELLGFNSDLLPPETVRNINGDLTAKRLLDTMLEQIVRKPLHSLSIYPLGDRIRFSGKSSSGAVELGWMDSSRYQTLCSLISGADRNDRFKAADATTLELHPGSGGIRFEAFSLPAEGGSYITISRQAGESPPSRMDELQLSTVQLEVLRQLAGTKGGVIIFPSISAADRCMMIDLFLNEMDTESSSVILIGESLGRGGKSFPRIRLPDQEQGRAALILDALRHNPDILVIEDCTMPEPLSMATRGAMQGKLVLAGVALEGTEQLLGYLQALRSINSLLIQYLAGIITVQQAALYPPHRQNQVDDPNGSQSHICQQCSYNGVTGIRYLVDCILLDRHARDGIASGKSTRAMLELFDSDGFLGISRGVRELAQKGVDNG